VFEFLRNEKVDREQRFDIFGQEPYKQNQFDLLCGPIVKTKTFFFGDYEGCAFAKANRNSPRSPHKTSDWRKFLRSSKRSTGTAVDAQASHRQNALTAAARHDLHGRIFEFAPALRSRQRPKLIPTPLAASPIATSADPDKHFQLVPGCRRASISGGASGCSVSRAHCPPQFGPRLFFPIPSAAKPKTSSTSGDTPSAEDNFFARFSSR